MSWFVISAFNRLVRKTIAADSQSNSVHDILLNQLQPRLPLSGTISTISTGDIPLSVPSGDSTANTYERDVIGNKSDAAQTTVGTTRSIMAYVKGVLGRIGSPAGASVSADIAGVKSAVDTVDGYFDVPTADATGDTTIRDVVGRKTDAAVSLVGTTKSEMAYLKGLIAELELRKTPKITSTFTTESTEQTVLNLSDKGVLTGIHQKGNGACSVRVVIDGTTVVSDLTTTPVANTPGSLSFNHKFLTSLAVYHTCTGGGTTSVLYTTD